MQTDTYVFIHRPGPRWLQGKSLLEQPLQEHFEYMTTFEAEGTLRLGGGFLDDSGAMGVLVADSLEAAERIVADDPAVRDQIVTATVHPWFVTVGGSVTPGAGRPPPTIR